MPPAEQWAGGRRRGPGSAPPQTRGGPGSRPYDVHRHTGPRDHPPPCQEPTSCCGCASGAPGGVGQLSLEASHLRPRGERLVVHHLCARGERLVVHHLCTRGVGLLVHHLCARGIGLLVHQLGARGVRLQRVLVVHHWPSTSLHCPWRTREPELAKPPEPREWASAEAWKRDGPGTPKEEEGEEEGFGGSCDKRCL